MNNIDNDGHNGSSRRDASVSDQGERLSLENPHGASEAAETPDTPSYDVGYGKPPRDSRFEPGRSGNPRGRKTGARNLRTYLREELARNVRVPVDGRQRNMPKVQLIAKQLVNAAVKGNPKSIEFLLKLVDLMTPTESEGEAPRPMSDQERQVLLDYLSSVDTATKASSTGDDK